MGRRLPARQLDHPLAFCDARTVPRSSLTPILVPEYAGVATRFESFAISPPATATEHRWFTFPAMDQNEVVVYRANDSERAEAGEAFWAPHSAFADPTAPPDSPARVSLEMRAVCLFDR